MPDSIRTSPEVAALLKIADRNVYTMAQRRERPRSKSGSSGDSGGPTSMHGLINSRLQLGTKPSREGGIK